MKCKFCDGQCVRDGHQKSGKQRLKCKCCGKKQQQEYDHAYQPQVNKYIVDHIKEDVGIRSLARLLRISTNTLMKRILELAKNIATPHITTNSIFEVDEIKTFVGERKIISG